MIKTKSKNMDGLWVPLVTPMYHGEVDTQSLKNLVRMLEPYVDGFVPCLSSGEGQMLNDRQWEVVVKTVQQSTNKPVIAGIKREKLEDTLKLISIAEELEVDGIIFLLVYKNAAENIEYVEELSTKTKLPIAVYNTEENYVSTLEDVQRLDAISSVIAIKDSSMQEEFFKDICMAKQKGKIELSVLQGMEHMLDVPPGCSGYLIALLNLEPELCKKMWEEKSEELNAQILNLFWKYNLGAEWYVTLKALLFARGVIRSSEQVHQFISP